MTSENAPSKRLNALKTYFNRYEKGDERADGREFDDNLMEIFAIGTANPHYVLRILTILKVPEDLQKELNVDDISKRSGEIIARYDKGADTDLNEILLALNSTLADTHEDLWPEEEHAGNESWSEGNRKHGEFDSGVSV